MLLNELKKQTASKLLVAVIAALVIINCLFCYLKGNEKYDADKAEVLKDAEKVVKHDPKNVRDYYLTMTALQDEYERVSDIWFDQQTDIMQGIDVETPIDKPSEPVFQYNYHTAYNDYEFLDLYYNAVTDPDEYKSIIEDVREKARQTLIQYKSAGYSEDSYAFLYQVRFWNIYGELSEQVEIDSSLTYGWDLFWEYDGCIVFLLLCGVIVGNRLFALERDSGMDGVIRSCRHGRKTLAVTKILYASAMAFGLSLVFNLGTLALCGIMRGLSSPFAPIQQNLSMIFSPLPVNQLEAFILCVVFSALAFLALCLFTALMTLAFRRTLPAIGVSALAIAAEFYLKHQGGEMLSHVNLLNCTSGEILLSSWKPIHFFDHPTSFLPILTSVLVFTAVIVSLIASLLWCKVGMFGKSSRVLPKLYLKPPNVTVKRIVYPMSLFSGEIRKICTPHTILICAILIISQIIISSSELNGELSFYDRMKMRYMDEYAELTLEETRQALELRLEHYANISNEETAHDMALKRVRGEITYQEYSEYCDELNEAVTHKKTVSVYLDEINYLIDITSHTGIQASPVIATGFSVLTDRDFDLPVAALLFILLSGIFAREHETSFKPLLTSTRNGRGCVWRTKIVTALLCSFCASLLSLAPDLILLLTRYPTDYLSHPLFCIAKYSDTGTQITFLQYLLIICFMRILGSVILGLLITSLSQLIKNEQGTAGFTLALFLPYALTMLGISAVKYFDISLLLSGDRLYLMSTESGNAYLMLVPVLIWCLVCVSCVCYSHRSFCR